MWLSRVRSACLSSDVSGWRAERSRPVSFDVEAGQDGGRDLLDRLGC
jgi:hypothetical protein